MKEGGGELCVESRLIEDAELQISVRNTGVGLPADKGDDIFKAFFTTKPQSTGIGLAISRSLIEADGGRLWASANSHRGTTFHFTLPREQHAAVCARCNFDDRREGAVFLCGRVLVRYLVVRVGVFSPIHEFRYRLFDSCAAEGGRKADANSRIREYVIAFPPPVDRGHLIWRGSFLSPPIDTLYFYLFR